MPQKKLVAAQRELEEARRWMQDAERTRDSMQRLHDSYIRTADKDGLAYSTPKIEELNRLMQEYDKSFQAALKKLEGVRRAHSQMFDSHGADVEFGITD